MKLSFWNQIPLVPSWKTKTTKITTTRRSSIMKKKFQKGSSVVSGVGDRCGTSIVWKAGWGVRSGASIVCKTPVTSLFCTLNKSSGFSEEWVMETSSWKGLEFKTPCFTFLLVIFCFLLWCSLDCILDRLPRFNILRIVLECILFQRVNKVPMFKIKG